MINKKRLHGRVVLLRKYLNGEFLEDGKFTPEELAVILTTNVEMLQTKSLGRTVARIRKIKYFWWMSRSLPSIRRNWKQRQRQCGCVPPGKRCHGNDVCFCTGGYYYLWFPGGRKWCLHTSDDVGKFEVRMPMFCHDCMIKCNCSVKDSYIFLGRKRKIWSVKKEYYC